MRRSILRLSLPLGLLFCASRIQAADSSFSAEISEVTPANLHAENVPSSVSGLARKGQTIQATMVALKDRKGQFRAEAKPMVAILRTVAWSPDDAARDGASEFEILICAARLISQHSLAGIVGVGNRHGMFLPSAEGALQRVAYMGMPVVRLAGEQVERASVDNLFIEGRRLSPEDARQLLAECLLRHGTLPPAVDPMHPTSGEIAAIKAKLAIYQAEFDVRAGTRVALR